MEAAGALPPSRGCLIPTRTSASSRSATATPASTACSSSASISGSSNRGYRVRPQVPAYGYRIDLVVTGGENRLAVECDGDEWHGAEQFETRPCAPAGPRARRLAVRAASARASSTLTRRLRCARCGRSSTRSASGRSASCGGRGAGGRSARRLAAISRRSWTALLDPFAETEEASDEAADVGHTGSPPTSARQNLPSARPSTLCRRSRRSSRARPSCPRSEAELARRDD